MPVASDDDVLVHRDAERLGHVDDRPRHLNVGARRRRGSPDGWLCTKPVRAISL